MFKNKLKGILNEDDLSRATAIVVETNHKYRGRKNWYVKTRGIWYIRVRGEWMKSEQPKDGRCEIYDKDNSIKHKGWTDEWTHWLNKA